MIVSEFVSITQFSNKLKFNMILNIFENFYELQCYLMFFILFCLPYKNFILTSLILRKFCFLWLKFIFSIIKINYFLRFINLFWTTLIHLIVFVLCNGNFIFCLHITQNKSYNKFSFAKTIKTMLYQITYISEFFWKLKHNNIYHQ